MVLSLLRSYRFTAIKMRQQHSCGLPTAWTCSYSLERLDLRGILTGSHPGKTSARQGRKGGHLKAGRAGRSRPPVLQSSENAGTSPPSASGGREPAAPASAHAPAGAKEKTDLQHPANDDTQPREAISGRYRSRHFRALDEATGRTDGCRLRTMHCSRAARHLSAERPVAVCRQLPPWQRHLRGYPAPARLPILHLLQRALACMHDTTMS